MTDREQAELQAAERARGIFEVVLYGYGERQVLSRWGSRLHAQHAAAEAGREPRPNGFSVAVEKV